MSWNQRGWLQVLALLLTSFMIWAELPRFALCKDNLHKHAWRDTVDEYTVYKTLVEAQN